MAFPSFIRFFAEKIGKPVSAFTKDDWQRAAITAAQWYDKTIPVPKRPGPKRKYRPEKTIAWLMGEKFAFPKKPVGRPIQLYGNCQVPISVIAVMIDSLLSKEGRKKWPKEVPRTKTAAARIVLRTIGHHAGNAESVLRSVRGFRKQLR